MKKNGEIIADNRLGFPVWIIPLTLIVSIIPYLLSLWGVSLGSYEAGFSSTTGFNRNSNYIIPYSVLVGCVFCLALFSGLLILILNRINPFPKMLAVGTITVSAVCSSTLLSLAPLLVNAGNVDPAKVISFSGSLARISEIVIVVAGIGLLILRSPSRIKRTHLEIIVGSLIVTLLSAVIIGIFLNDNFKGSDSFQAPFGKKLWDILVLVFYSGAGVFVFLKFHKKIKNYISQSLYIIAIPLIAGQLYLVLGSKVVLDHGFISAYSLRLVAFILLLSAVTLAILEIIKKDQSVVADPDLISKKHNPSEQSEETISDYEALEEGVFGIDHEGITTSINSSAQLILGYSEVEFIGLPLTEVIDYSITDPKQKTPVQVAMEDEHILEKQRETFKRKEGSPFIGEFDCTPIQGDDKSLGAIITFKEIVGRTPRDQYFYKALHEASKAREEAEKANQSKSYFLSIMSHEIRTPLSVILGYAEILQRTPSLPADQKECVSKIETSGNHLLELINDILDISKIEAGEIVLNSTDFDLNELVNGLAMMFRNRCETKNLEFYLEGIDSQTLFVNGDEGKIRQILVNLLGNAVKFTSHGKVGLRVEGNPESIFKFSVSDTGNGIPLGDQKKIFEPFKQGKDGLNMGGTGLGLPISWELAELMGGTITIVSEEGKGSTFTLNVELKSASEPVESRRNRNRTVRGISGSTSLKALVVDDAQENRVMLCRILKSIGVSVAEADNGDKALEKIREVKPDIIFMDKRMPVMNGDEATRKIVEIYGRDKFKIVGVTASAFSHERETMLSAGCTLVIGKPFRMEQIFQCIQSLLQVEYDYQNVNESHNKQFGKNPGTSSEFSNLQIPVKLFLEIKDRVDNKDSTGLVEQFAQLSTLGKKGKLLESRLSTFVKEDNFEGIMDLLEKIPVVGTMHD